MKKDTSKTSSKTPHKASHNDKHTTSSPTPRAHDEQTGHDVLSQQAHISGKEVVGEDTPTKVAHHAAGIMTEETTFVAGNEPAQPAKLSSAETAERISKLSKPGDPYEFDSADEANEVFAKLDPDLFILMPGETKTVIQRR